jgi:serine-type D-Ala-D-Ala carboxypeptidase (penicillin-binding protein 5/6)
MMKKILLLIFLLFYITNVSAWTYSYTVMDADSGRVLASENNNEKMLIASTTKIMTAIIALENGNLNSMIEVGDEIKQAYGSMIYIKEGEIITLEDLLYGLLLRSGNDAAIAIAKNTTGYDKFIELMNIKAKELKMYNSIFKNPHGLDEDTKNYSTSYDLALLMRYAMKNSVFRKITSSRKYFTKTNLNTYKWYNKNDLLLTYKYSTGGKIGYTTSSKHVFVSSATKDNKNLIVVTIKDTDRFNTHKALYEKYFNKYEKYKILDKYTFSLKDDNYKNCYLYIKNDFYMLLNDLEKEKVNLNVIISKNKKDTSKAGVVQVIFNNKIIHEETIYYTTKENKISKLKKILLFWK